MIDVLVVDDDFRVAEINAAYVAKVPGFRVTARAHTTAQALATLERVHVDLVLLDHYLPDETGLTLVRRMRQLGHTADVIMVTAARDVTTVQTAMRYGALQYLVKPFSFGGLRAKLDGYAALRRTLDGVGGGAARPARSRSTGSSARCARRRPHRPPGCPRATRRPPPTSSAGSSTRPDSRCPRTRSPSGPASAAPPRSAI